jgi:ATP-dependent Clp protease ATP-binding subunit ClpA
MDAKNLTVDQKLKLLKGYTEDDFRDQVIRPLFCRKGFTHGSDMCGPDEAGKDCYFLSDDEFGTTKLTAVQTKSGNLNLAAKPAANLLAALTQVQTALNTKIPLPQSGSKVTPSICYLCVSGKINQQARNHIVDTINDPRIRFLDADDLINQIDNTMPELWQGVIGEKFPYLKAICESFENETSIVTIDEEGEKKASASYLSDAGYVGLKFTRTEVTQQKRNGKLSPKSKFIEKQIDELLSSDDRYILLVGDAGSGKTTTLKRIVLKIATVILSQNKQTTATPVYLKAQSILVSGETLAEHAIRITTKFTATNDPAITSSDLNNGQAIILIDAIDELGSAEKIHLLGNIIDKFITDYPTCRIFATSRNYRVLGFKRGQT